MSWSSGTGTIYHLMGNFQLVIQHQAVAASVSAVALAKARKLPPHTNIYSGKIRLEDLPGESQYTLDLHKWRVG